MHRETVKNQTTSWKANISLIFRKEIPFILWNPKVHCSAFTVTTTHLSKCLPSCWLYTFPVQWTLNAEGTSGIGLQLLILIMNHMKRAMFPVLRHVPFPAEEKT
jgi:hypothetical protein